MNNLLKDIVINSATKDVEEIIQVTSALFDEMLDSIQSQPSGDNTIETTK